LGSYAEQVAVRESNLHHIPPQWKFKEVAGLAATATVSYGALAIRGRLTKGETVLIHAAAGGLGLMAVQIAKGIRCHVIATASTQVKLDVAKRFVSTQLLGMLLPMVKVSRTLKQIFSMLRAL